MDRRGGAPALSPGSESGGPYSLWVQHNFDVRRVVVYPGYPVAELAQVLEAAFGEDARVVGATTADGAAVVPLATLCANPSFKGIYKLRTDDGSGAEDDAEPYPLPTPVHPLLSPKRVGEPSRPLGSLFKLSPEDADALLGFLAEERGEGEWAIDRMTWRKCLERFLGDGVGDTVEAEAKTAYVIDNLFTSMNKSGGAAMTLADVLNGLFVLSGGDAATDAALLRTFRMWNAPGSLVLEKDALEAFLLKVFTLVEAKEPTIFRHNGLSPPELARMTAERCWRQARLTDRDEVSYAEFRRWYLHPNQRQLSRVIAEHYRSAAEESARAEESVLAEAAAAERASAAAEAKAAAEAPVVPAWLTLGELARLTGVRSVPARRVAEDLLEAADSDGRMSLAKLASVFDGIAGPQDAVDYERTRTVVALLSDIFDPDHQGVPARNLAGALAALSGSSRADKAGVIFDLFADPDRLMGVPRMFEFLGSLFTMAFTIEPEEVERLEGSVLECVAATVEGCFESAELVDGCLTRDGFIEWYIASGAGTGVDADEGTAGAGAGAGAGADTGEALPGPLTVGHVAAVIGLDRRRPAEVLAVLSDAGDEDANLTRDEFLTAFCDRILSAKQRSDKRVVDLLDLLFDLFDSDEDGIVSCYELAAGVAQLCRGSIDDKAEAAFSLLDANSDGYVSQSEMVDYLTSVFTVLFRLDPTRRPPTTSGLTAAGLAVEVTDHCFDAADVDGDHRLSLDEFKAWTATAAVAGLSVVRQAVVRAAADAAAEAGGEAEADTERVTLAKALTATVTAPPSLVTMEEVRRITGLADRAPIDVLAALEGLSDELGNLSREAFVNAFVASFLPPLSSLEYERARLLLDRLFDVFDLNCDGVVDCIELSAGLVPLCGGTTEDFVAAAFALYDANNDGVIELGEMESFLTAAFKVLFRMEQTDGVEFDCTPRDLALRTAAAAWQESNLKAEQAMSLDKFRAWYQLSPRGSLSDMVIAVAVQPPKELVFDRLRSATGLGTISASDALVAFQDAADDDLNLSREAFHNVIRERFMPKHQSSIEYEQTRLILDRVFDAIGSDSDVVDFKQLAAGVAMLCGGSPQDQVEAAFAIIDADSDGFITVKEMEAMLTAVYRVVFKARPAYAKAIGTTPEDLAARSTRHCFADADKSRSGKLSLDAFKEWYATKGGDALKKSIVNNVAELPSEVSIDALKSVTGLASIPVTKVWPAFEAASDEDGNLSRKAFGEVFRTQFLPHQSSAEYERSMLLINRVFTAFDVDGDGVVDSVELATGLTMLCGESEEDRVAAAFALYDQDNDGVVTRAEMCRFLESVFTVIYELEPDHLADAETSAAELAATTTSLCFVAAADDGADGITLDQFRRWVTADGSRDLKEGVLDAATMAPASTTLEHVARLTGLDRVPANVVLAAFEDAGDDEGTMGFDDFMEVFRTKFLGHVSSVEYNRARLLLRRLFACFDQNDDGLVDGIELATGLIQLCAGSRDKVFEAFCLFDKDNDGRLTKPEMVTFLTSLIRVTEAIEGGTATDEEAAGDAGVRESKGDDGEGPATTKAREMVSRCFHEVGVPEDGGMTLEQLREWYSKQYDTSDAVKVVDTAADMPAHLAIQETLALTDIGDSKVDEALQKFAAGAKDERLHESEFVKVFVDNFVNRRLSNVEHQRLSIVLGRLFSLFDVDHSGTVDLAEAVSGLALLCGGTREDMAAATFQFYDKNGDGVINFVEMVSYLRAVFDMLFAMDPAKRFQVGMGSRQLAEHTARQCFRAADVDSDGTLTFEEFQHWFTTPGGEMLKASVRLAATSGLIAVEELQSLTGLGSKKPADVFDAFAAAVDPDDGSISRANFHLVFRSEFLPSDCDVKRTSAILDRVFDALDTNHNDQIELLELQAGLSNLCGGEPDDRIRAAFDLLDRDDDGCISVDEMTTYLESVYKVSFALDPSREARAGMSAESLAIDATKRCFWGADLNDDGLLSYSEFKRWYCTPPDSVPNLADLSVYMLRNLKSLGSTFTCDPLKLAETILEEGDPLLGLNRSAYNRVVRSAFGEPATEAHSRVLLDQLFDSLDSTGSGRVTIAEATGALTVLCATTADQHTAAAFAIYDSEHDGTLSPLEVEQYLLCVFRVMQLPALSGRDLDTTAAADLDAVDMAAHATEAAFNTCDLNDDGLLTFSELQRWLDLMHAGAESVGDEVSTVDGSEAGSDDTATTPSSEDEDEDETYSLADLQHMTNLAHLTIGQVLGVLRDFTTADGVITRRGFNGAFRQFNWTPRATDDATRILLQRLFDAFDIDGDGVISPLELVCGLSVLCGGTKKEKVKAVFEMFDLDGDGTLSEEEMAHYLTSVYRVVFQTENAAEAAKECTPEELGAATAEACFAECGITDDRLSFEQFQAWFESSGGGTL